MKKITFVLGSTSVHKLNALEDVLAMYGFVPADVVGYKAASGQPEQPFGLDAGYVGAKNRALDALRQHGQNSADETYFVGIESFVDVDEWMTEFCVDMAAIVVLDQSGKVLSVATSPAFPFPMEAFTAAERAGFYKTTVGSKVAEMYGGDGTDPHSILSGGRVTRMQTLMAGLSVAIHQLPIF